jgi:alkylation response protein AidB-like acyl-CoA dehydrogenase
MKTDTALPEERQAPVIDTSKMSPEQRAAMELTEAAREVSGKSFAGGLFMGQFDFGALHPFPQQRNGDRDQGDAFLERLHDYLKHNVDPDEIDRTGEIPEHVFEGLAKLGAFGIKVGTEYGGLGLSQTNYCRAAMLLGSYCGNLTALISAHQSIGVPQPLILFGTEEQKKRFLPRVAGGEVSAFALTEPKVGSDPAKMETRAEPTPDGQHFIINGEKLWCTNGSKAGCIVVMAKTPPKDGRNQVTAFLLDMDTPGVEIVRRCRFMGLKALYNAVVRFKDVKVPRENILLAEGKGLRVALTTLNTGRLTLPAGCTGLAKRCLEITREWASDRVQWGAAIGKHAAIAEKISKMAAQVFAMEAMTFYTASLVDRDKTADIRLEAAMCKLWASERSWEIIDETMQIRGGRGYETADSLRERGEHPIPVERMFRDCRINRIFEGSSEIMRLFIAREALDPHLKVGAPVLNTQLPNAERARAAMKAAAFYAKWYPRQWMNLFGGARTGSARAASTDSSPSSSRVEKVRIAAPLQRHMRWAEKCAHRLARTLFHSMARYGPKLEREQVLLGRYVDIGTELFAMGAACARAGSLVEPNAVALADFFCRTTRLKIEHLFEDIHRNTDRAGYRLSQKVLGGEYTWLENGILRE